MSSKRNRATQRRITTRRPSGTAPRSPSHVAERCRRIGRVRWVDPIVWSRSGGARRRHRWPTWDSAGSTSSKLGVPPEPPGRTRARRSMAAAASEAASPPGGRAMLRQGRPLHASRSRSVAPSRSRSTLHDQQLDPDVVAVARAPGPPPCPRWRRPAPTPPGQLVATAPARWSSSGNGRRSARTQHQPGDRRVVEDRGVIGGFQVSTYAAPAARRPSLAPLSADRPGLDETHHSRRSVSDPQALDDRDVRSHTARLRRAHSNYRRSMIVTFASHSPAPPQATPGLQALDDRDVGLAAALAHGLQAVAAAGALELVAAAWSSAGRRSRRADGRARSRRR